MSRGQIGYVQRLKTGRKTDALNQTISNKRGDALHELGAVIEVIKIIDEYVEQNDLTEVDKIVLQIGELSSMLPEYVEACYPAVVDGTNFEKTKLEIEIIPGNEFTIKEIEAY